MPATRMPATAGPITREALNIEEFRAMALIRSSRPTISTKPTAKVLQVLKGSLWHGGQNIILHASEDELRFHENERLIVLLDPSSDIFEVLRWQVLPPTSENLALARSGIAEDYENSGIK